MNTKSFFLVTINNLRQHACFITVLSLFVVFLSMNAHAKTYEYDDLDRVTKVIDDDGSYTVYEYDAKAFKNNKKIKKSRSRPKNHSREKDRKRR